MKVIVVDDERNARETMQKKLKQIPSVTEIAEFANPLEAFAYVKENPVDVAFLDIEMYEMSGIEMAKRIKDIQPKTNIVFVTGYSEYTGQALSLRASGYILKPATMEAILEELENLRFPVNIKPDTGVFVQTFGHFEVFVNGKPLVFSRTKAKELFAYLIDRHGSSVTTAEIAALLWEDRGYDRSIQNQTQNMISHMMATLREARIPNIIIKSRNQLAVDRTKIECDYYRMLNGDMKVLNAYAGEYMKNYSWAEMTAGLLSQRTGLL